jgi:hypothetical protein
MWTWARRHGLRTGLELIANFVAPVVTYTLAKPALGDVDALMVASLPPLVWAALELVRRRRIDALSILVLTGIALSLLAFLGGGGVRLLQLREQLVAATVGLVFLSSAALGRPLIHQLARARMKRKSAAEARSFDEMRGDSSVRRTMMVMTIVWGVGLLGEATVSASLIFCIAIERYLIVSPIIGCATVCGLTAWSFWYARRHLKAARRRADRCIAARAAMAGPPDCESATPLDSSR